MGTTIHSGSAATSRSIPGLEFLPDDGEAARLIRAHDWASTPLGPPGQWSPSLRMMVPFMLANRFPMLLWWGPDYVQIYNDAYIPVLGTKHPDQAMGKPVRECWHEIYDVLAPLIDTPFQGGPSTWMEDIELILRRHGFAEESHFTIAYSPVPDESAPRGIGGVLATVHEITEKIIGERRVKILSELGTRVAETRTDVEACREAVAILARDPKDVPFALLYLVDDAKRELRRVATTGIAAGDRCPTTLSLDSPMTEVPWPLARALETESIQLQDGLSSLLHESAPGPWPDPPDAVAVVPIQSHVAGRPAGVLVVGVSACIRFDGRYTSFLELLGAQVATAIANARAYEEERRRAEALAEIDHAKTTFFSNVSHEFRTPLTLMLGPLEDVQSMPGVAPAARQHIEIASRNAQRLLKLVNSLLDFSRIEAGRSEASFAQIDLAALTVDLASTFRSAMQRANLDFQVDCPSLDEPVFVDREMWEKIVLNLLSNAFKFTLKGRVRIQLRREGSHAVLEVADTGAGVPEHELPRLFERFHRVEGTEARTHEGSGIGLALVQELVRLHGGTIEAESRQGAGSTFRVRIPFGAAHIPSEQIHSPSLASTAIGAQVYVQEALRWLPDGADSETAKLIALADANDSRRDDRFAATFGSRIVLADDNSDMRAYVSELLGPLYQIESVADGAMALAAAQRERPDLIVTDVMMPRMGGFELLTALRADRDLCDIPVIVLSARAGEDARIEGLSAGADDYLVKPFHARELLARVGAILELRRVRRESDERFRAYVQATSEVVYRMSPDWSEMRQLEGRNFIDDQSGPTRSWMRKYIHEEDQERVQAAIDEAIRTRTRFELAHRVIRPDGSTGWTFSRAIPLFDDRGSIVEWFGAATDVTERREAQAALERQQKQLEQADRQKNEFLAMLAHELRNPLAPIRNAGELLSQGMVQDPQGRLVLATVDRQVKHLTRLVDDLLDISRITQGRIELRRSPVRLDRLIANAVETVDPLIRQKEHRVSVVSSRKPLVVNGDPDRLVQCIGNVLANAAKYTPSDGEIRVESRAEGGSAVVSVTDNGVGIPEELKSRIFDLFVQGERTLDRAQGGLGVGLTIVRRLVEMHGGSITVASKGVNQGATFEIRLPLADENETRNRPAPARRTRPRRILVVDDNADGVEMLARLLQLDGHEVETALSGSEALECVPAFAPDIVILDIGLPGIDGYEVARRIRAEADRHPVQLIAITGYGREEDQERAREAGFAAHLVKPVEFTVLERVLAEL